MNDALENLLGVNSADCDLENECLQCHRLFPVKPGEYYTSLCNDCAVRTDDEE